MDICDIMLLRNFSTWLKLALCIIQLNCCLDLCIVFSAVEYIGEPWPSVKNRHSLLQLVWIHIIISMLLISYNVSDFSISDLLWLLFNQVYLYLLVLKMNIGQLIQLFAVISQWNAWFLLMRRCTRLILLLVDLLEYFRFIVLFVWLILDVFKCCNAFLLKEHMKWD